MSRKKNLLDYLALTLFIMCMGLALSASLEYVTRATEREYLGQGIWVLSLSLIHICRSLRCCWGGFRASAGRRCSRFPKTS